MLSTFSSTTTCTTRPITLCIACYASYYEVHSESKFPSSLSREYRHGGMPRNHSYHFFLVPLGSFLRSFRSMMSLWQISETRMKVLFALHGLEGPKIRCSINFVKLSRLCNKTFANSDFLETSKAIIGHHIMKV